MRKRMNLLFAVCATLLVSGTALGGRISDNLAEQLRDLGPGEFIDALVMMDQQYPAGQVDEALRAQRVSLQQRHEIVVTELRELAAESQQDVLALLELYEESGEVRDLRSFHVANMIYVNATVEVIEELAARGDTGDLYPNYPIELIEPEIATPKEGEAGRDSRTLGNGLPVINAPQVWYELGINGTGTLVCNIDTGVDGPHTALTDRWRGNHAPAAECFYDPVLSQTYPYDSGSHGTHTMGTITGMSPSTGDTVGVAWGAEWIAAATIDHPSGGGIEGTIVLALQSFEWALDPDGDPGTLEDMPDVISNSWGIPHAYRPECDETYWVAIDNCEAAGEVVVFAAGNESFSGLRSPASRAATIYTTFAVAALNIDDPENPYVASFSSRGPSSCTADPVLMIKPDISAPGENIYSSVPGGGYQGGWSGTSMACPHIAGVVALMRSANPGLDVTSIKQIIFDTAIDLDTPGDDNNTGMGMIDAYTAVTMAMTGYGRVAGTVTDLDTGDPLQAVVSVVGGAQQVQADANGDYFLALPGDSSYTLKYNAFGYVEHQEAVYVTVDDTTWVDVQLQIADQGTVAGIVNDTHGHTVEGAEVSVPGTPVTPVYSGPDGSYSIDLPGDASYDFLATAAGLGSELVEDFFVTANTTTPLDFYIPDDPIYSPTPPDDYGYVIYDINDVGGVPYVWNSISGVGTPMSLSDDDYTTVATGFDYDFYGTTYSQLTVCSNGYVAPGTTGYTTYSNQTIPNPSTPNGCVYPHWDDINPASGGMIYTYLDPATHEFIVEWNDTPYYGGGGEVTMQVVLQDPAYYPTVTGDGQWKVYINHLGRTNSCTVGIENPAGDDGIQYVFDNSYHENASPLQDEFTLLITTGWLSEGPHISFSPDPIDLGTIYLGYSYDVDYQILNLGLDTLFVTDIIPSAGILVPEYTSYTVVPIGSEQNTVSVTPVAVGAFSETLTHVNNSDNPNAELIVSGTVVLEPDIDVDPLSIVENLETDQTSTVPLNIRNDGGSVLSVSLVLENVDVPASSIEPPELPDRRPAQEFGAAAATNDESVSQVPARRNLQPAYSRTINVLLFRDNLPWGYDVNQPLLEGMGVTVSTTGSSDMGVIDLTPFDLIVIESQQDQNFYNAMIANQGWFEDFLSGGGVMQIHTATWSSYRINDMPLPGGLAIGNEDLDYNNYISDPGHPMMDGISEPLDGNYASHEYFNVLPDGTQIITENESGLPTTVEHDFGPGSVVATGQTWEHAYSNGYGAGNVLPNALAYSVELASGPDWIALGSSGGDVNPTETLIVDVLFNSEGLADGEYNADIVITSNDPDEPEITVPATLIVGAGCGIHDITVEAVNNYITIDLVINGGEIGNEYHIYRSTDAYGFGPTPVDIVPVTGPDQVWSDTVVHGEKRYYRVVEVCDIALSGAGSGEAAVVEVGR